MSLHKQEKIMNKNHREYSEFRKKHKKNRLCKAIDWVGPKPHQWVDPNSGELYRRSDGSYFVLKIQTEGMCSWVGWQADECSKEKADEYIKKNNNRVNGVI